MHPAAAAAACAPRCAARTLLLHAFPRARPALHAPQGQAKRMSYRIYAHRLDEM